MTRKGIIAIPIVISFAIMIMSFLCAIPLLPLIITGIILFVCCKDQVPEEEEVIVTEQVEPVIAAPVEMATNDNKVKVYNVVEINRRKPNPKGPELPVITQYERDVITQIEKLIFKYYEGEAIWDGNQYYQVKNRWTLNQKAKIGKNIVKMEVEMNSNGPTKIIFPDSKYQEIIVDKTLKPKKENVTKKHNPKSEDKKAPLTNAEKKGNTIINEDGKPEVKPNYKMVASDWINTHLEYLNKACNDAMVVGSDVVEALLSKTELPSDKEAWEAIGALLKEQEEIDRYQVTEDGIIVTIE